VPGVAVPALAALARRRRLGTGSVCWRRADSPHPVLMRKSRLIPLVFLSLLGGAGTTIAVAWGCSLWSPASKFEFQVKDHPPPDLALVIPSSWLVRQHPDEPGAMLFIRGDYFGRGFDGRDLLFYEEFNGIPSPSQQFTVKRERAGWPFLALEGLAMSAVGDPDTLRYALPFPDRIGRSRVPGPFGIDGLVPLKPVPGFALDTLMYALALFVLIHGTRWTFRAVRLRRNSCPACGYARTGLPAGAPCPECGTVPAS
jgi:hypothetical protein